jgi:hypothetical protein
MAVNLAELLALPMEERTKLAEALLDSVARAELEPLAREFIERTKRTNAALDAAIARLERFDDEIERQRAEVREAVMCSGEIWPFPLPHVPDVG